MAADEEPAAATTQRRPASGQAPPSHSAHEERRTVSVLFADLSGYTAMAEQLDPEDVKDLLDDILGRLTEQVTRYGGRVDKYIGDNVMALFGAPVAHEDDAERAVRAGLAMQDAIREINEPLRERHGVSFALRIGINTGDVLAGNVGESYTVVGDAVNVAARLEAAAEPGSVIVGERTYRATHRAIEYRALDAPLDLKGKRARVLAWEAVGAASERPFAAAGPALAPLIGRRAELELLAGLVDRITRERRPHVVTVIGEAGVGKSRLLREFESRLESQADGPVVRQGRCPAYGAGIVFWPLGEILRAECGIADGDSSEVAFQKLSSRLDRVLRGPVGDDRRSSTVKIALVGRLLGIELPEGVELPDVEDAQRTRELLFSAVRAIVEGLAQERPLVLAWEDVHWADEGMLDLIEHLNHWVHAPLLQVCLARDELQARRPRWGSARRTATTVFLEPLDAAETKELVSALLSAETPTGQVVDAVAARAEGNPLFAEEMVRLLAEEEGTAVELPETVHALLASRLDALEPVERRILAHAAVVGRTFWEGALAPVAAEESTDLQAVLDSLRDKDLLRTGEGAMLGGEPELAFKHVLIRDVAYDMLPKAVRAQKHFQVAEFIEDRAGERPDEVVGMLAEHYGRGVRLAQELKFETFELGDYRGRALRYSEAAGEAAMALYSNEEALAQYEAALGFAAEPAAAARVAEKQGDVALRLGRADTAIQAWEKALDFRRGQEDLEGVAELHRKMGAALTHKGERKQAIEHHQRGINLIKDGPPSLALVRLYEEAAWLYVETGDNMLAIYASEKALRLAERLGETRAASRAHGIFGRVFGRIGDMTKARENLMRAAELARGADDHETVLALAALGHHLETAEGDYAGAAASYGEGLTLAERIGDIPAQIDLHAALAQLAGHAGHWEDMEASTNAAVDLGEREGLIGRLCLPYALRALLHWRRGEWPAAEDGYRRSLDLANDVGASEISVAAALGLATCLRDRRELVGAEGALTQALDTCERAGLIVQSIQVGSARAVLLSEMGRDEQAHEAAAEAARLAERVHYPIGEAAALEATGAVAEPAEAQGLLSRAADTWDAVGRPLDAARCRRLLGARLMSTDPAGALAAFDEAGAVYERLEVHHRAQRVRELMDEVRTHVE